MKASIGRGYSKRLLQEGASPAARVMRVGLSSLLLLSLLSLSACSTFVASMTGGQGAPTGSSVAAPQAPGAHGATTPSPTGGPAAGDGQNAPPANAASSPGQPPQNPLSVSALANARTPRPLPVTASSVADLPVPELPPGLSIPAIPEPDARLQPQSEKIQTAEPIGTVRVAASVAPTMAPPASTPPPRQQAPQSTKRVAQPELPPKQAAPSPTKVASAVKPPAASQPSAVAPGTPAGVPNPPPPSRAGASRASSSTNATGGAGARIVYAKIGDDITIALDGEGWTFTGGGSSGNAWEKGVRYESRSTDSNGTTFIFKAKELGKWVVQFQQQNASSGSTNDEIINIHVLTSEAFAKAIAGKAGAGTGASASGGAEQAGGAAGGDLAAADWLYKEGKYTAALDAYEKAWVPNDPALTDKIAELAYRVGRYKDARQYWQKNYGLRGTTYGELAVAGLMKTATAQKDAPELRALFDDVHALRGVGVRSDLLDAARFLYTAKDWAVAVRYLDEYLARYDGGPGADAADFLLGQIYQGDTPMQDAQKALKYYRTIVAHYPASEYYERAKTNIIYLNRHFFEIR